MVDYEKIRTTLDEFKKLAEKYKITVVCAQQPDPCGAHGFYYDSSYPSVDLVIIDYIGELR